MAKVETLVALQAYLIQQGLVRDPFTAGTLPACWIEPPEGTPAPNQGNTSAEKSDPVVSLYRTPGPTPAPGEGFIRQDVVLFEIYVSPPKIPEAYNFEDDVRTLLNDRRAWTMGSLLINQSMIVRDIQRLTSNPLGVIFNFQYNFDQWGPFQPAP